MGFLVLKISSLLAQTLQILYLAGDGVRKYCEISSRKRGTDVALVVDGCSIVVDVNVALPVERAVIVAKTAGFLIEL